MAPLRANWLEPLPTLAGPAVVTPPVGATRPSVVLLGVHGAGDRPEWSCGGWRLASQASAFVVCPQGNRSTASKFAWTSSQQIAERSDAALEALRARYGPYVIEGPIIYAGFSQGASLAGPYLRANAARIQVAILAEGGYQLLASRGFLRDFHGGGGRRLVVVCGTPGCFAHARRVKKLIEQAGIEALTVGNEKAGHNLNLQMQQALQAAWPDIVARVPP